MQLQVSCAWLVLLGWANISAVRSIKQYHIPNFHKMQEVFAFLYL